jgi:hypothetical protein
MLLICISAQIKILTKEKKNDVDCKQSDKTDGTSSPGTLDSARSSKGSHRQDLQRELKSGKDSDQRRLKERQQVSQQKRQEQMYNRVRSAYKPDFPPEVFLEDTYKCHIGRYNGSPGTVDREIFTALKFGEFCLFLNPCQLYILKNRNNEWSSLVFSILDERKRGIHALKSVA